MNIRRKSPGFALAYAFLVSMIFIVFFAALLTGYRGTLRANRFSEDSVRAKCLANLGNEFVYQLFLEHGTDFISLSSLPFTFSNDPNSPNYLSGVVDADERLSLAAQLSPDALGGTFEVVVGDARAEGVDVPQSGSYWSMACKARVNDYQTTLHQASRFLVKVGTPFVNYLKVGRGQVFLYPGNSLNGPVFATTNTDSNETGTLDFRSSLTKIHELTGTVTTSTAVFELSGVLESNGQIRLIHRLSMPSGVVDTVQRSLPKGSYVAGEQLFEPATAAGLAAVGPLTIRPNSGLSLRQDDMNKVLAEIKAFSDLNPGLINNIDISAPSVDSSVGILVEIESNKVFVYEAAREVAGKLFDLGALRSIYDSKPTGLTDLDGSRLTYLYGPGSSGLEAAVREAEWDDPAFPNEPYPAKLLDDLNAFLASHGVTVTLPTEGDYFEVCRVVPGRLLREFDLSDSSWTSVRLVSTSPRAESKDVSEPGPSIYPPVFVRGRVDGKLFLSYDEEDTSSNLDEASIYILGDARGSVPGGITLVDEASVILDKSEPAHSDGDMVLLLADGEIRQYGLPVSFLQRLWVESGSGGDWQDILQSAILEPDVSGDQMYEKSPTPNCKVFAASVASVDVRSGKGLTTDLRRVVTDSLDLAVGNYRFGADSSIWKWEHIRTLPGTLPHASLTGLAILPRRMRLSYICAVPSYNLTGARCALDVGELSASRGEYRYDYRWRSLTAEDLSQVLGLPIGPILIDRRGL